VSGCLALASPLAAGVWCVCHRYGRKFSPFWVTVPGSLPASPCAFTITDLAPSTRYIVKVRARNANGWGPWSFRSDDMPTTAEDEPPAAAAAAADAPSREHPAHAAAEPRTAAAGDGTGDGGSHAPHQDGAHHTAGVEVLSEGFAKMFSSISNVIGLEDHDRARGATAPSSSSKIAVSSAPAQASASAPASATATPASGAASGATAAATATATLVEHPAGVSVSETPLSVADDPASSDTAPLSVRSSTIIGAAGMVFKDSQTQAVAGVVGDHVESALRHAIMYSADAYARAVSHVTTGGDAHASSTAALRVVQASVLADVVASCPRLANTVARMCVVVDR